MNLNSKLFMCLVVLTGLSLIFGCNESNISLADLPVCQGATELKADNSKLANTLQNNMETDKEIRQSMGPLAVKGSVEQKGFSFPAKSQWKDIELFYNNQLTSMGWRIGLGGIAGKFVDVNQAINAGGNKLSKTAIYSKGKQTLTIMMLSSPDKYMLLSLSTT